jgi:hypothetical protein
MMGSFLQSLLENLVTRAAARDWSATAYTCLFLGI